MALPQVVDGPTSTLQLGTVATVVPSGTASAAWADGSDSTYVQFAARARQDTEKVRVAFTAPTLPTGAKVQDVALARRVQTVVLAPGDLPPVSLHWHRCLIAPAAGSPAGAVSLPSLRYFQTTCPTDIVSAWADENLGSVQTAPDGTPWDVTTNLSSANYSYEAGRGDDEPGSLRISKLTRTITYQRISVVAVTGPTGTISTTQPAVQWTHTSPDQQPQEWWQVAVYPQAATLTGGFVPFVTTPLQQSGWTLGEDLAWTLTAPLVDGVYVAYVQAKTRWAGPGEFPTLVASGTFTRTASTGGAGTFAPTATLNSATFDATNNRTAIVTTPGAGTATVAFTFQRSDDGGQSWTGAGQPPIPSLTMVPANGTNPITVYDRFAPIGQTALYRVLSYATTSPNAAAAFSTQASVTTFSDLWWLRHPTNPLLDTPCMPKDDKGHTIMRPKVMGTFSVISRNGVVNKKVIYGPSFGDDGELVLIFNSGEASENYWDNVDQLERANVPLFLQRPDGTQYWVALGPGTAGQDAKLEYVPMPGDPGNVLQRTLTVSYVQVDAPAYF